MRQVQKLASKNRRKSSASIALEVAEVEGQLVSAQTIRHALHHVGLHGRRPRRKPLLKLAHKKPANSLLKTTWPRACITGAMSCGLMSLRQTCLAQMVSSMCGDALVRSTKKIVPCLQSSMVVVASWSGAA